MSFPVLADGSEPVQIFATPETAAPDGTNEPTNVCRVSALSALLGDDGQATEGLTNELTELGFSPRLAARERAIGDFAVMDVLSEFRRRRQAQDDDRIRHWQRINETLQAEDMGIFLFSVLGSGLQRESTAAASALWRQLATSTAPPPDTGQPWLQEAVQDDPWFTPSVDEGGTAPPAERPDGWAEVFDEGIAGTGDRYEELTRVTALLRWRLRKGLRSDDRITRSLALAAFLSPVPSDDADAPLPVVSRPLAGPPGVEPLSTMIHGTWGWKGAWWRPQGDFYEFILPRHQINLYRGGARYSWSGALSSGHRHLAGAEFYDWADEIAPNGLQAVFAHSYGGEVAARAIVCGTRVQLLVLLSTPVTRHVSEALPRVPAVVDVRLPFDPVLALACRRQRIKHKDNVTTVILSRWRLDHSATHNPRIWDEETTLRVLHAQWQ